MADDETPPPSRAGGGHGLGKKIGPLPLGAWAVILGGVVGVVWFMRNRSKGQADTADTAQSAAAGSGEDTPTSLVPINQGLSEDQFEDLMKAIKRLHGAPSEDDDDDDKPPVSTLPAPVHHPPLDKPPWPKPKPKIPAWPKPKPKIPPKKHHPKTVTTVKWTKHHTPWASTLWGIAHHEHVKGGWQYLEKINHMHGDPRKALKPGMKIKLSE